MCTYLEQVGSVYYFRRNVPEELQPFLSTKTGKPRTIWKVSLRTKDREEAKRLLPDHVKMTDQAIDAARAMLAAAIPESPADISTQRRTDELSRAQFEYNELAAAQQERDSIAEEARQEALAPHIEALETKLANPAAQLSTTEQAVRELLRAARERGDVYGERWRNLQAELRRARKESGQESVRDSRSEISAPQAPTLPISPNASVRTPQGKTGGIALTALYDQYTVEAKISPATIEQWRKYICHLVSFLRFDDAGRVTTDDLLRWRQDLKQRTFRGKTLSSKTINGSYLAAASVTFAYGFAERILPSNPMRDVGNVRADRKPKLRDRDFTIAERKLILSAASKAAQSGRLSNEKALARRWVPWICAYTGARVNEITQLRKEDFTERGGIWCIHITPEAGGVKTEEARYVPIHEHLIEQGLLQIVETATNGPLFYDPANSRGGKRPPYKIVGQRIADWLRDDVGLKDENIKPSHAWRHTFKTICREAEIDEGAADYMQGHASKGVARHYGSNTLPALAKQLAKFPRFLTE